MSNTITSSAILADLQSGLTRKEIQEKYALNGVQLKEIFRSPSLKNKKTIKVKGASFVFVDDLGGATAPEIPAPVLTVTEEAAPATQENVEVQEVVAPAENPAIALEPVVAQGVFQN